MRCPRPELRPKAPSAQQSLIPRSMSICPFSATSVVKQTYFPAFLMLRTPIITDNMATRVSLFRQPIQQAPSTRRADSHTMRIPGFLKMTSSKLIPQPKIQPKSLRLWKLSPSPTRPPKQQCNWNLSDAHQSGRFSCPSPPVNIRRGLAVLPRRQNWVHATGVLLLFVTHIP